MNFSEYLKRTEKKREQAIYNNDRSLWGDKENGKYMSDPIRENMDEEYLKLVDEMEDNPEGYYLIVEWKKDGTPVSTCCMFPEDFNYDIAGSRGEKSKSS